MSKQAQPHSHGRTDNDLLTAFFGSQERPKCDRCFKLLGDNIDAFVDEHGRPPEINKEAEEIRQAAQATVLAEMRWNEEVSAFYVEYEREPTEEEAQKIEQRANARALIERIALTPQIDH